MYSLSFLVAQATAPFALLVSALRYYTVGNPTYQDSIQATLLRTLKMDLIKWFSGKRTENDYRKMIKPIPEVLKDMDDEYVRVPGWLEPYGDKLHWWVKQEGATRAIVFLHGGGYVAQMVPLQAQATLAVWWNLDESVRTATNVVVLDYTLAWDGNRHPTQVNELKALYRDLVRDGYDEIVLLGDSAGGHLALAYLRDMDASLPPPIGVVLVAPWIEVTFGRTPAVARNEKNDTLPYDAIARIAKLVYTEGLEHQVDHNAVGWDHVELVAQNRVLVLVGEHEILREQIVNWCNDVGVDYEEEPRGVHDTWAWVETMGHASPRATRNEWAMSRVIRYVNHVAQARGLVPRA